MLLQRLRDAQLGRQPFRGAPPGWSSTLVRRLKLERTLEGHDGCVNTVHFSPDGQLLVSGSDDMQIIFWDWQLGQQMLSFNSGHHNNVFQARIMPHSANSTVVTCAADGLVRVAHVPQGGGGGAAGVETRRLACHRGRAHKLALEPDSPHCFLSCGEDGEVRHFDLREPAAANRRLLACRTHRGRLELNSVHCNPGSTQFCVAGGDPFVRLYDLRRPPGGNAPLAEPLRRLAPWHLRGRRGGMVTITCAVFGQHGRVLATYNDENIYLFAGESEADEAAAGAGAAAAAGSAEQREAQRRAAGRTGGAGDAAGRHKRGRSSTGDDSSRDLERGAAARARSAQRRAAAAAALAREQSQRAASGAAAAAEAHASMRRGLMEEEEEAERGASAAPPAGPQAAQPDGSWLARLPPPRAEQPSGEQHQRQQQAAAASGGEGEEEGSPPPWPGGIGGTSSDGGSSAMSSEGGGTGSDAEDAAGAEAEAEEGVEVELEMTSEEEEGLGSDEDDDEEDDDEDEDGEEFEAEGELPQGALVDDGDTIEPCGGRGGGGAVQAVAHGGEQAGQPGDSVLQTYKGHRNYRTVKGVSFLGGHDEFVMSGSDCGHIYVWDTASGEVQAVLKGDADTVNCLEPHPSHLLSVATSGIEDTIKLWAPTAEEPQVLGAAEQRRMAANERAQGEERRMFISPQMLNMLLRARAGTLDDTEGEEGSDGEGSDGEGGGGRRHRLAPGDCTLM